MLFYDGVSWLKNFLGMKQFSIHCNKFHYIYNVSTNVSVVTLAHFSKKKLIYFMFIENYHKTLWKKIVKTIELSLDFILFIILPSGVEFVQFISTLTLYFILTPLLKNK